MSEHFNATGADGTPEWARSLAAPETTLRWLDDAAAAYRAMPAGDPGRPMAAYQLAMTRMLANQSGHHELDPHEIIGLLSEARHDRPDDPLWQQAVRALLGTVYVHAAVNGDPSFAHEAVELLAGVRDLAADNPVAAEEIDMLRQLAAHFSEAASASIAPPVPVTFPASVYDRDNLDHQRLTHRLQTAVIDAQRARARRDPAALTAAVADLETGTLLLSAADPRRSTAEANLAAARIWLAEMRGVPPTAALGALAARVGRSPRPSPAERGKRGFEAGFGAAALATGERDQAALDKAIEETKALIAGMPPDRTETLEKRIHLGSLYCVRLETFRTFDDAGVAVDELSDVAATLDATHRLWSLAMYWLAVAHRMRDDRSLGDRARSRDAALAGLRGHAWQVLIQSGTPGAEAAGRSAAADAADVLAWCIEDDQPEAAVRALDSCRGLVLYTTSRAPGVADQLIAAGRPDLAGEWRGYDLSAVPASVRQRVMRELLTGGRNRLLDPPSLDEIRAALRRESVDALVYLVPPLDDRPPVAIAVPASGAEPRIIRLSAAAARLHALDEYLRTDPAGGSGARTLGALADWAWHAAMEKILAVCPGSGPHRLVLVPLGEFGLVPWHAARAPGGRYAIEDAVVSYASSARVFCGSAARDPVAYDGGSLVVGDPTGDRPRAGDEAIAIHERFYPGGAFLGRYGASDGAGTPGEVLDWLAGTRERDRGVLHLACPGTVDPRGSFLELAGPGGRLAAERIARDGAGGYRLGTVVLAACATGVSGGGYDEAYSLSTAFLCGGARSVIGSLWPVPDQATSLLMYMLHHNLHNGLGPAESLRRAQLWLLDRRREPPDGMPDALRDQVRDLNAADLVGWAGFTHLGKW